MVSLRVHGSFQTFPKNLAWRCLEAATQFCGAKKKNQDTPNISRSLNREDRQTSWENQCCRLHLLDRCDYTHRQRLSQAAQPCARGHLRSRPSIASAPCTCRRLRRRPRPPCRRPADGRCGHPKMAFQSANRYSVAMINSKMVALKIFDFLSTIRHTSYICIGTSASMRATQVSKTGTNVSWNDIYSHNAWHAENIYFFSLKDFIL